MAIPGASSEPREYFRVKLADITVLRQDRQRRSFETEDLQASIKKIGLLQPVVVRRAEDGTGLVLVAGERRLEAVKALGWSDIPVRHFEELEPIEASIIELEENIKRKDLVWQDQAAAIGKIHALHCSVDEGWTIGETAESISLSISVTSMYLRVNGELQTERVREAGTLREAYNVLTRRDQRLMGDALESLLEAPTPVAAVIDGEPVLPLKTAEVLPIKAGVAVTKPTPAPQPESILVADFVEWAPKYKGPKFNLLHCDFPYGVSVFAGPQGRGSDPTARSALYDDSLETFEKLLEVFCINLNNFASLSMHLLFWHTAEPRRLNKTLDTFAKLAPSVQFAKFPLIWLKSDNAGISPNQAKDPRHVYETCLFGSRGERNLVKIKADAYSAPTDKRFHVSTKPEPMLRHFMEMIVDENTTLFDPTCGSAAALRAAESLGAKKTLGLEIDRQIAEVARQVLKNNRLLRTAR